MNIRLIHNNEYKQEELMINMLRSKVLYLLKNMTDIDFLKVYQDLNLDITEYKGINYCIVGTFHNRILIYVFSLIKLDDELVEVNKCFYRSTGHSRGVGKYFWIPTSKITPDFDCPRIGKDEDEYIIKYYTKLYISKKNYEQIINVELPILEELFKYGRLINKFLAITSKILFTIDNQKIGQNYFDIISKPFTLNIKDYISVKTEVNNDINKDKKIKLIPHMTIYFCYLKYIRENNIPMVSHIVPEYFKSSEEENERVKTFLLTNTNYNSCFDEL
jgi:hypothetical protein